MKKMMCYGIGLICLSLSAGYTFAGDAEVLPKGRTAFSVDYKHYIPWDERYDKNGNVQNAASDFNTALDSTVFPDLGAFNGLVPGTPNIGTSIVSFKYNKNIVDTSLGYGITDKLSIGVKVPYVWMRNSVTTALDTTNANVGKNNLYNAGVLPAPFNSAPLLPLAAPLPQGAVSPLTKEDVLSLLGKGLTINGQIAIPGFGFKPFETWEEEGLGDIEAGLKYQYYKNENWRLAGSLGAVFPTGKVDDPDNLVDQPLGDGSYAVSFRSYNDFTGIKNLTLNGSIFYTLTLPQDRDRRVVTDPHQPLTNVKQNVSINPGDIFDIETSASYLFNDIPHLEGTSASVLYKYSHKFSDEVTGPNGRIPSLEEETSGNEHVLVCSLGYSTLPMFMKKEFPIPMKFTFAYRNRFAGDNSAFKTQYLLAQATVFF